MPEYTEVPIKSYSDNLNNHLSLEATILTASMLAVFGIAKIAKDFYSIVKISEIKDYTRKTDS